MIKNDNTSYLEGVVDISPTEAWAAGIVNIGMANPGQVIERWEGTAWSAATGAFHGFFTAVSADAANDIWAVGCGNFSEPYDGTSWKLIKTLMSGPARTAPTSDRTLNSNPTSSGV
jgi:hypothetical protein